MKTTVPTALGGQSFCAAGELTSVQKQQQANHEAIALMMLHYFFTAEFKSKAQNVINRTRGCFKLTSK